jgi:hypothetical protein
MTRMPLKKTETPTVRDLHKSTKDVEMRHLLDADDARFAALAPTEPETTP